MECLINGLKVNYKVIGEGKSFLVLHGWGSESEKWQRVGELLAKNGLKVIIPDLPGFGQSDKPKIAWNLDNYCDFVAEFVKFLGLEKFYLLGHSFGGAVAVKCSLKFPKKIEKLFLVDAACIRRKNFKVKLFKILSKIFKMRIILFRKIFYRKSDYLSVEGVMRDTYLKIIAEDLSGILSQVQVPTIIIWGEKDKVTPLKQAHIIHLKIRDSELEIIPKTDHDLNSKAPEKLFETLIKFL